MSVWREVQETLEQRWSDGWAGATIWALAGEAFDPAGVAHARVRVQSRPGAQMTLGSPGNRKMSRQGVVFALLRVPPGTADGALSDLAEKARGLFEAQRFGPHSITFGQCDVGPPADIEGGRWWGLTVECRFGYEELV